MTFTTQEQKQSIVDAYTQDKALWREIKLSVEDKPLTNHYTQTLIEEMIANTTPNKIDYIINDQDNILEYCDKGYCKAQYDYALMQFYNYKQLKRYSLELNQRRRSYFQEMLLLLICSSKLGKYELSTKMLKNILSDESFNALMDQHFNIYDVNQLMQFINDNIDDSHLQI